VKAVHRPFQHEEADRQNIDQICAHVLAAFRPVNANLEWWIAATVTITKARLECSPDAMALWRAK
jgi:hypothetical protein